MLQRHFNVGRIADAGDDRQALVEAVLHHLRIEPRQIEDADFAAESSNLVQGKILSKAAIALLAFSNRNQAQQMKTLLGVLES